MKKPAFSYAAFSVILCGAITANAQMIEMPYSPSGQVEDLGNADPSSFASDKFLSGVYQLPEVRKTQADLSETAPLFVNQDPLTLSDRRSTARRVENVLDLSVLRETSAYRHADRIKIKVSDAQATGIQAGLAELAAAYRQPGDSSDSADCPSVAMSVEQRIKLDPSEVLSIVESEIGANPNCACEIVKMAIKASGADEALVGDITEVAITAAPQSMRMISQCAIAAMPEALASVQAVLAKLDPNSGDTSSSKGAKSAKSSKSGKDAKAAIASEVTPPVEPPNPLDLPVPIYPPLPPPPYIPPPEVTDPNP